LREVAAAQRTQIGERERTLALVDAEGNDEVAAGPPPRIGDDVQVSGSGLRGRLESISGARAQLRRGSVRFDVPLAQLRRLGRGAQPQTTARPPRAGGSSVQLTREETATALPGLSLLELNLVGARVQSALERLETFLDQATLDDVGIVRIIHGMGTGALRDAVREYLGGSPYVSRFEQADRRDGGAGATIAYLR
jgi:DNA mismatch repair protein MutS2